MEIMVNRKTTELHKSIHYYLDVFLVCKISTEKCIDKVPKTMTKIHERWQIPVWSCGKCKAV